MTSASARYPGRAPIDAYGSILCLPSGIYAWPPTHPREIEPGAFAPVFAERDVLGLLLLGTGRRQEMPSGEVRRAFVEAAPSAILRWGLHFFQQLWPQNVSSS